MSKITVVCKLEAWHLFCNAEMISATRSHLTPDRLLRLQELSADDFELLLLGFLRSHPLLTVGRSGRTISARVIEAATYARSGRQQKGVDIRAMMEGGETWVFQCKRVKKWDRSQTRTAITATTFAANHHVLVLACNPPGDVHDEIAKHANWTLWNLDTVCAEIRLRTPPDALPRILPFLSPDELKRFTPFASEALIAPDRFFAARMGTQHLFRHDWELVGRKNELDRLAALLKPDGPRGMAIYSKGGDGKSRLLLEFARHAEAALVPVVFLNPSGAADALDFSLLRDNPLFIVVVDDAHRPDVRHGPLLQLIEQEKRARLLIATRPQGFEPMLSRLIETGLREDFEEFPLTPLRKPEIRLLAKQALGGQDQHFAEELTELTKDSAFLTVLAGELIRLGRMRLGEWASEEDFRARVFKAFEEENLRELSPGKNKLASRLLRVLALLAPAVADDSFAAKAAECLTANPLDVDDELKRLRRIQILSERGEDSRIIPDLFADFLAWDVAIDSRRRQLPLLQAVRREFPNAASAMLRNLAEAAWAGGRPAHDVDAVLAPLVEAEFKRFRGLSHYRRAVFLSAWAGYGVYLPAQTLDLARLALSGKKAPVGELDAREIMPIPEPMSSHEFVLEKLPALLEPIALHHKDHRDSALDALWEIGTCKPLKRFLHHGPHAWETIGRVLKPQAGKPAEVCVDGLDWLHAKLSTEEGLARASENFGLLKALAGGCFTRFIEFHRQRGSAFTWWQEPVPADAGNVRRRALKILAHVIEKGDWRAGIGVLRVLDDVMRRIVEKERWVAEVDAFRIACRRERLAGLELWRTLVQKYPQPAVRFLARKQVQDRLRREEDSVFREAAQKCLAGFPEDLDSRMSRALLDPSGATESNDGSPWDSAKAEASLKRWETARDRIFAEFRRTYPDAATLLAALSKLDAHLRAAECHPSQWHFFGHLARSDSATAISIAELVVESFPDLPLARAWPALIDASELGTSRVVSLEKRALAQPGTEAACAAITLLFGRRSPLPPITAEERSLVLEAAARARNSELNGFMRELEFGPGDESLAREVLIRLPVDSSANAGDESILRILSRQCADDGSDGPLVRILLAKLVALPELDPTNSPEAWHLLATEYPRELLDFLKARVELEVSGSIPGEFRALSKYRQIWLNSATLHACPDYEKLREDIWRKSTADDENSPLWLQLFQTFGLGDTEWLAPRLFAEISAAKTVEELRWVTRCLSFRGSLMIFRQPELTRQFLNRARELNGVEDIRAALCCATGSHATGWTNGKLNETDDYVETEAIKAAELHAHDEELHLFFREIAEAEQSHKRRMRIEHELRMRELDG